MNAQVRTSPAPREGYIEIQVEVDGWRKAVGTTEADSAEGRAALSWVRNTVMALNTFGDRR